MKKYFLLLLIIVLLCSCASMRNHYSNTDYYQVCRDKSNNHEWTQFEVEYTRVFNKVIHIKQYKAKVIIHNTDSSTSTLMIMFPDHYTFITVDSAVYVNDANAEVAVFHRNADTIEGIGTTYYRLHCMVELDQVQKLQPYSRLLDNFSRMHQIEKTSHINNKTARVSGIISSKICTPESCFLLDFPVTLSFSTKDSLLYRVDQELINQRNIVRINNIEHGDKEGLIDSLLDFSSPRFKNYSFERGDSIYLYTVESTAVEDTLPHKILQFPFVQISSGDTTCLKDICGWKCICLWTNKKELCSWSKLSKRMEPYCSVLLANPESDNLLYTVPIAKSTDIVKKCYHAKRFFLYFPARPKYYLISPENIIIHKGFRKATSKEINNMISIIKEQQHDK